MGTKYNKPECSNENRKPLTGDMMVILFQSEARSVNKKEIVPPFPAYLAAIVEPTAGFTQKTETREVSIFNYYKSKKPEYRGGLYFWIANSKVKMEEPRYNLAYESLVDLHGSFGKRIYLDFPGMEIEYTNSKGEEVTIKGKVIMGELLRINKDPKKEGYELTLKHGTHKSEEYTINFKKGTLKWKSGIKDSGSEVTVFSIKEVGPDESRKSVHLYLLDEKGEKITDLTENHWKHIFAIAKRRNELADLLEDKGRQIVVGGEGFKTEQTALDANYIRKGGSLERSGDKYILKLKNGIEMDWSDLQSIIDSIKKTKIDFVEETTGTGGSNRRITGYAYFVSKDEQGIKYEVTGAAYLQEVNGKKGWLSKPELK